MEIVLASNNLNKLKEVNDIFAGSRISITGLDQLGLDIELIEDETTIEANALSKADQVALLANLPAISDDSGIFVDALDGFPGVYSARFLGDEAKDETKNEYILEKLGKLTGKDRSASFRCAVGFVHPESNIRKVFLGVVKGHISNEPRGGSGFGYDPIFIPDGYDQTFAELGLDIKNRISHRAIAFRAARDFILSHFLK